MVKSLLVYCPKSLHPNFFKGIPGKIPVIRIETWMSARKRAVSEANKGKDKEYLSTGVAE